MGVIAGVGGGRPPDSIDVRTQLIASERATGTDDFIFSANPPIPLSGIRAVNI
jgi:hypothetical protein